MEFAGPGEENTNTYIVEKDGYEIVIDLEQEKIIGVNETSTEPEPTPEETIDVTDWNYSYTGQVETFTAPYSGEYKLEVWGASGGYSQGSSHSNTAKRGKGGYSTGIVNLAKGDIIYILVGGEGSDGYTVLNSVTAEYKDMGWNSWDVVQGTKPIATPYNDKHNGYGGGATDIRIGGTTLYHRLIVAGGGGGSLGGHGISGAGGGVSGAASSEGAAATTQISGYAFGVAGMNTGGSYPRRVSGGGRMVWRIWS